MGLMNSLDLDSQELLETLDKVESRYVIDYVDGMNAGLTDEEIDSAHGHRVMDALMAAGWVPPTVAEVANRRVRDVIEGQAPSIMEALVNVSDLLTPAGLPVVHDEPLADWEVELLQAIKVEQSEMVA